MSLHVLIPARAGSAGVPDKNIRPLHGRSLIERALGVALALDPASITISTDYPADRLPPACRPYRLERPEALATSEVPMSAVLAHWADQGTDLADDDDVALLQPTSLHQDRAGLCRAVLRLPDRAAIAVDVVPTYWHAAYQIDPEAPSAPPARRQGLTARYRPNGAVYCLTGAQARTGALWGPPAPAWFICAPGSVFNIDTPEDWRRALVAVAEWDRRT